MTPDRGPVDLKNPQSWNRYNYAASDPVNLNDPNGKLPVCVDIFNGVGNFNSGDVCGPGQFLIDIDIDPQIFAVPLVHPSARDLATNIFDELQGSGVIDDYSFASSNGVLINASVSSDFFQAGIDAGIIVGSPGAWTIGGVIIRGVTVLAGGEVVLAVAGTAFVAYELYQIYQKSDIKQWNDAVRQYERECGTLDEGQKRRAHDEAAKMKGKGEKLEYDEIIDLLKGLFGCPKKGN